MDPVSPIAGWAWTVVMNAFVMVCAIVWAIYLQGFHISNRGKFVATTGLLFFSTIILLETVAGMFGFLERGGFFLLTIVVFSITVVTFGRRTIAAWKALDLGLPLPAPCLALLVFLSLVIGQRFYGALFQVPLEYDSAAYHLPFVVAWLREASLWAIPYTAFAGPIGYYPGNFELFTLWTFLGTGTDQFTNLVNIAVVPLILVFTYGIARNLGMRQITGLLVGGLLLCSPVVLRQMGAPLVDLFFITMLLGAVYFLQEWYRTSSMGDLVLAGMATGLFIGTKFLGLPFLLPLVLAPCIILCASPRHRASWRALISLSSFALAAIACGGFWYARNLLLTGNPVFPAEIKVAGQALMMGYYGLTERIAALSLAANIRDLTTGKEFVHGFTGTVGWPGIVVIVSLFFAVVIVVGNFLSRKKTKEAAKATIILLLAAYAFMVYWYAPYTYSNLQENVRYALPFLAICCIAYGLVISQSRGMERIGWSIGSLAILVSVVSPWVHPLSSIPAVERAMHDLLPFTRLYPLFLAACALGTGLFLSLYRRGGKTSLLAAILFLLTVSALPFVTRQDREKLSRHYAEVWYPASDPLSIDVSSLLSAARWFDTQAPQARIAYAGFNFIYPFYGRTLQREVDYININSCRTCRYAEFKDDPASIRGHADFTAWMKNLQAAHKEYLVVTPLATPGVRSYEFEWAEAHPEDFSLEFNQGETYVYQIRYH